MSACSILGPYDAAALAGALEMRGGADTAQVTLVGKQYADQNGIDLLADTVVSVDVDGGQRQGQVAVDVNVSVPRFFLGALCSGPWEIGAHAVAEVVNASDANYARIALDSPGTYINGASKVSVLNGSIMSSDNINASGDAPVGHQLCRKLEYRVDWRRHQDFWDWGHVRRGMGSDVPPPVAMCLASVYSSVTSIPSLTCRCAVVSPRGTSA